jgi:hypothetical protein
VNHWTDLENLSYLYLLHPTFLQPGVLSLCLQSPRAAADGSQTFVGGSRKDVLFAFAAGVWFVVANIQAEGLIESKYVRALNVE